MLYLAIRTDKPEAELQLSDGQKIIDQKIWQADRHLAESLHTELATLLKKNDKSLVDITGIIVFAGPGSFTGLRIGISVANALAYSLGVPAAAAQGNHWLQEGVDQLVAGASSTIVQPEYGAEPHITAQKR